MRWTGAQAFDLRDKVLVAVLEQEWRKLGFVFDGLKRLKVLRQVLEATGIAFQITDRSLVSKSDRAQSPWRRRVKQTWFQDVRFVFEKSAGDVGVGHDSLRRLQG